MEKEVKKRKELLSLVLNFIDDDNDADNFQALTKFSNDNNISKTKIDLEDFLHLLINIANNHHRSVNFFSKILQIFNHLLPDIRSFFSNDEIVDIFWQNKIIMLNFFQNKSIILGIDKMKGNYKFEKYIYQPDRFLSPYYALFLYFNYKSVNDTQNIDKIEKLIKAKFDMDVDSLQQLCQEGENDYDICKLIRHDSINDFISYVNEKNVRLNSNIPFSLFETNQFFQHRTVNLIDYAAFFGSVQIFKYLLKSNVTFDTNILEFAVHGRNPEIIHLVEESLHDESRIREKRNQFGFGLHFSDQNKLKGPIEALTESIKCYHNEIANYIEQNGCEENDEEVLQKEIVKWGFSFYNYEFIPDDFDLLLPISKYFPKYYRLGEKNDAFQAFYLITKITIPSSVTKLPDLCFNKLSNLKEVVISSSVKEIGDGSFYECSSLELVSILSKLELIGKEAFVRCSSLKQISFPSSLKSIGDNAFNTCSSLVQISFEKNSMLKSIGKNAFANCISLTEVMIPSSLMSIEEGLFMNCIKLFSVSFDEHSSLVSIGKSAFALCSSLTTLIIPSSVTSIDDYTFECCTSLSQFLIPSSIISIGECSFYQCTSLVQISIPDSVKSIGRCAFDSCSSLIQVSIPSSLTSISDYLFKNCFSLKQISIPSSVTCICRGSFEHCTSLHEISIHPSMTAIGDHAFEGCSSLKQIIIPSSVASIGDYSFRKCISLEHVTISSTKTKIGDFAFSGCTSLPKSQFLINKENLSSNQSDEISKYLQNRKELYINIIDYLESSNKISEKLLEMIQKIAEDEYDLIELLNLLSNLSMEASSTSFIHKIEQIIDVCKEKIPQKISDNKLCNIFKRNKRILIYLFENKILKLNRSNINVILNAEVYEDFREENMENFLFYFHPELDQINYQLNDETYSNFFKKFQTDKNKQKIGENDNKICEIIRNDLLEEFILYYSKKEEQKNKYQEYNNNYQLIPKSLYETNQLLYQVKYIQYIQYAAFYGAIKIFNYLYNKTFDCTIKNINSFDNDEINENQIQLEKNTLWYFAIHGGQHEILHMLDIKGIKPSNELNNEAQRIYSYSVNRLKCNNILNITNGFEAALQCHQNDIARNLIKGNEINTNYLISVQNFNFEFIGDFYKKFIDNESFLLFYLCFYDYPKFVQLLIKDRNINLDSFSNNYTLNLRYNLNYYYYFQYDQSDKFNIIDAIARFCSEIVKFFKETNKRIEFDGCSLINVMKNGNYELFKEILSQPNIDVNKISTVNYMYKDEQIDRLAPLYLAILNHDIEIISLLLNHPSINVNLSYEPTSRTTYRTALHIAIEMEFLPAVKLLLERPDIDVNAIANFDDASFNFLSWSKTQYFDFYYTPLHEAVELENIEIIKLLLAHPKIDVNKIEVIDFYEGRTKGSYDRVKQSVLCRAIQKQNCEIVKLLLEHQGINVNRPAVYHQNDTGDSYYENRDDEEFSIAAIFNYFLNVFYIIWNFFKTSVIANSENGKHCEEKDVNDDEYDEKYFNDEHEEEEEEDNFYGDDDHLIIKRTPLQFAYAGESKEILQLLLGQSNIKDEKTNKNDILIKKFTKYINTNPSNNNDMSTDE